MMYSVYILIDDKFKGAFGGTMNLKSCYKYIAKIMAKNKTLKLRAIIYRDEECIDSLNTP